MALGFRSATIAGARQYRRTLGSTRGSDKVEEDNEPTTASGLAAVAKDVDVSGAMAEALGPGVGSPVMDAIAKQPCRTPFATPRALLRLLPATPG
jgi:hypothetical protein